MIKTEKYILQTVMVLLCLLLFSGCKSWRDGIADYTEESYDSAVDLFDKVAVDFKIKDRDKYERKPYEDEILINNKWIQLGYSPRIDRLMTIERLECENLLYILSPEEEKEAIEDGEEPDRGGVCLLYDMRNQAQIEAKPEVSGKQELLLRTPKSSLHSLQASLKIDPEHAEVVYTVKASDSSISRDSISARFEFKSPLSMVFEDKTGKLKNSRIVNVRPNICYFVPSSKESSELIKVYGSWMVILYRNDMMILAKPQTKKALPYPSFQFKTTQKKLVLDTIILPSGKQKNKVHSERWQVLYRTALYNPTTLTDYLIQNHINILYKR